MIEASFECQEMTLQYDGVISDSVRFLEIHFDFDEYWDEMDKTAVFEYGDNKYLVALADGNSMYLGDNICYVPQEVIKATGFTVAVFGTKNGTVITSSQEPVSVGESGINHRIPADPTPSAWSQMLSIANNALDIAESVEQRADDGEFDGVGVPQGGSEGQVLVKDSGADYDTAWQSLPDVYTKTEANNKFAEKTTTINGKALSGNISLNHQDVGAYQKPSSGIPKTDLADDVKASLLKADSAIQSHQSLSDYATKHWVENKNYLTTHQDINGKQDKIAEVFVAPDETYEYLLLDKDLHFDNAENHNVQTYFNTIPLMCERGAQSATALVPTDQRHLTNKKYVDDNLNGKADKSDTYTKAQVNTYLAGKQDKFADVVESDRRTILEINKDIMLGAGGDYHFLISNISNDQDIVNKQYVDNHHDSTKQDTATAQEITIPVGDWSGTPPTCTPDVTGITANNIVFCDASNPDVQCTAQGSGTLTFTASSTPTASVTVKVVILP